MKKKLAQKEILDIIANDNIENQEEIQIILQKKNIHIPQATLSRYLKQLNIIKNNGFYRKKEKVPDSKILNIDSSNSGIIVIHTHPGHAGSLAYLIDQQFIINSKKTLFLGCIAGDDTIFIVIKEEKKIKEAISILKKEFC